MRSFINLVIFLMLFFTYNCKEKKSVIFSVNNWNGFILVSGKQFDPNQTNSKLELKDGDEIKIGGDSLTLQFLKPEGINGTIKLNTQGSFSLVDGTLSIMEKEINLKIESIAGGLEIKTPIFKTKVQQGAEISIKVSEGGNCSTLSVLSSKAENSSDVLMIQSSFANVFKRLVSEETYQSEESQRFLQEWNSDKHYNKFPGDFITTICSSQIADQIQSLGSSFNINKDKLRKKLKTITYKELGKVTIYEEGNGMLVYVNEKEEIVRQEQENQIDEITRTSDGNEVVVRKDSNGKFLAKEIKSYKNGKDIVAVLNEKGDVVETKEITQKNDGTKEEVKKKADGTSEVVVKNQSGNEIFKAEKDKKGNVTKEEKTTYNPDGTYKTVDANGNKVREARIVSKEDGSVAMVEVVDSKDKIISQKTIIKETAKNFTFKVEPLSQEYIAAKKQEFNNMVVFDKKELEQKATEGTLAEFITEKSNDSKVQEKILAQKNAREVQEALKAEGKVLVTLESLPKVSKCIGTLFLKNPIEYLIVTKDYKYHYKDTQFKANGITYQMTRYERFDDKICGTMDNSGKKGCLEQLILKNNQVIKSSFFSYKDGVYKSKEGKTYLKSNTKDFLPCQ
jgi:hypothetical protein